MCACVSPLDTTARVCEMLARGLNWNTLLELAEEHGVQGMLARRLEEVGYARMPAEAHEQLQARMRAQSLFTLSLTAEFFRILEDFSQAGIDAIPVKGPVISQLAYGDPALRSFGDVDLLVRQRDIPKAIERMQAMGLKPELATAVLRSGKLPGEYLFRRAGTPRIVELHSEATFRHYPTPMRIEELMARRRRVSLDGREVPALSLEDELVFDCVHGGKDFWERLMWVCDVAALLTRYPEIDWGKAWRAAADVRAERILLVGVRLAAKVFELKLSDEIARASQHDLQADAICEQIARWLPYAGYQPPSVVARAVYRAKMGGGGVAGISYLMRLSLSPTEDDWREDALERRSWLWDALRRPFRLIRKYGSED